MTPDGAAAALLALEDGTAFRGVACGADGTTFGEAVFNTGMAGYQEILTDPSYRGQIVTMTAAHIGNYGLNEEDAESDRIQVAGYVVRESARRPSSWRSRVDLRTALRDANVVAIEGVDTRRLVRHLRERGAMRAGLSTEMLEVDELVAQVQDSPGMLGRDLAREVTTPSPYTVPATDQRRYRIVAYDFGIKRTILRLLSEQGCEIEVVPATSTAEEVLARDPDGVFLSNGPGDPAAVTYGSTAVRGLLGQVPVFGICLGAQLLGLALGGSTYKLRFGHRGVNQPVLRVADGAVEITSHNHGFAIEPGSLDSGVHGGVRVSHVNLNDDVVEGLECLDIPAFAVQYHPEAAPGPHDAAYLFPRFVDLMSRVGQPG